MYSLPLGTSGTIYFIIFDWLIKKKRIFKFGFDGIIKIVFFSTKKRCRFFFYYDLNIIIKKLNSLLSVTEGLSAMPKDKDKLFLQKSILNVEKRGGGGDWITLPTY